MKYLGAIKSTLTLKALFSAYVAVGVLLGGSPGCLLDPTEAILVECWVPIRLFCSQQLSPSEQLSMDLA